MYKRPEKYFFHVGSKTEQLGLRCSETMIIALQALADLKGLKKPQDVVYDLLEMALTKMAESGDLEWPDGRKSKK